MIDQIISRIEELAESDKREFAKSAMGGAASTQLQQELSEGEGLYYKGAGKEALDKWRSLTEEEKKAQQRGDDIDEVNTTDLEEDLFANFNEISLDFYENNRINMARAFLGMDGGYSIRKLKKFYK